MALADIHREHLGRPALEEAIREPSGRGAEAKGGLAGHVEPEMPERMFQLETAAADEPLGRVRTGSESA